MAPRKQVTVRILKSKTDLLWYKNKIGQSFKVRKVPGKNQYEQRIDEKRSRLIYGEDCEEIRKNELFKEDL